MPKVAFSANLRNAPEEAIVKTHNRWHPDIPMIETYRPGAEFRVECFDWTGGQIAPDDSANDVRDVDLTKVHYLSGPFGVEGAEPGDLMVVDLLDIGYLPDFGRGDLPASSRERMAAAFWSITIRRRARRSGTFTAFIPLRGTSRGCVGPVSRIPG